MARARESGGDLPPVSRRVTFSCFRLLAARLYQARCSSACRCLLPGRAGFLCLVCPLPGTLSFLLEAFHVFLEERPDAFLGYISGLILAESLQEHKERMTHVVMLPERGSATGIALWASYQRRMMRDENILIPLIGEWQDEH